jgi:hypothetical protein
VASRSPTFPQATSVGDVRRDRERVAAARIFCQPERARRLLRRNERLRHRAACGGCSFQTRCSTDEVGHQLATNKRWVEDVTGRACDFLAYPNGDYDERVLQCAKDIGFSHGFAVIPRGSNPRLEIGRTGIYSASLFVLGCKLRFARQTPLYRWASALHAFAI